MQEYMNANQAHWNEITPSHVKSKFYDVEGFKAGKSSLKAIELDELGDVTGKSLLHLQCHFGMDTMSWARLGAKATGADFSENAIETARSLSDELDIDANFVLSNVYDLPDNLDERFDIVFTSYGVLYWLPDMQEWAKVVDHFLKPGGTFYIAEFHPFANVFDDNQGVTEPKLHYPYFQAGEPLIFYPDGAGSYADSEATVTTPECGWHHSMGEVVSAIASVGLRIEFLHEFQHSVYQQLPFMARGDDGFWRLNQHEDKIPLMYSIKATKSNI